MSDDTIYEIRGYPNRRFYDRSRKRYLTLGEIEALVLEGKTGEVHDSRTGEDITRQILTQILMQRQPEKMDVFPVAMLHSVLRANDLAMNLWRS
jgi:polyhydroxyalkanoate synthesis repressor PhaR